MDAERDWLDERMSLHSRITTTSERPLDLGRAPRSQAVAVRIEVLSTFFAPLDFAMRARFDLLTMDGDEPTEELAKPRFPGMSDRIPAAAAYAGTTAAAGLAQPRVLWSSDQIPIGELKAGTTIDLAVPANVVERLSKRYLALRVQMINGRLGAGSVSAWRRRRGEPAAAMTF